MVFGVLHFVPDRTQGSHPEEVLTLRFYYSGGSGITLTIFMVFGVLHFVPDRTQGSHPEEVLTLRFYYSGGSGIRTRGTVTRTSV